MKTKKLSSYQKLKRKIKRLNKDIYNLVENKDKLIGIETAAIYKFKYDASEALWFSEYKNF